MQSLHQVVSRYTRIPDLEFGHLGIVLLIEQLDLLDLAIPGLACLFVVRHLVVYLLYLLLQLPSSKSRTIEHGLCLLGLLREKGRELWGEYYDIILLFL